MEITLVELRVAAAFALACALALDGLRKKSLDISGAIAAFVVGFIALGASVRFGLILIIFYWTSSKLTKWKSDRKAKLEANFKAGGQRDAIQVLANSALATCEVLSVFGKTYSCTCTR